MSNFGDISKFSFREAVWEDFVYLEGSADSGFPSEYAFWDQRKSLIEGEEGVRVTILYDGKIVGLLTFASFTMDGLRAWTTQTFLKQGVHSNSLSRLLKNSAHTAVYPIGEKFFVFVNPDNQPAIISMSKIWESSEMRRLGDGTLAYAPLSKPLAGANESLVSMFKREISRADSLAA